MKEIIYLNTDFINSFMAQKYKGLPLSNITEHMQQDTQTNSDVAKKSGTNDIQGEASTGGVDIPFIISSPSGKIIYKYSGNKQYEEAVSLTQTDAGKEIVSKQLHDNALDDYEEYLVEKQLLNIITDSTNIEEQIGNYVKITSHFSLFDLEYIRNLTDPDSMKNLIRIASNTANSNQNSGKQNSKQQNSQLEQGIKAVEVVMKYLSSILPTKLYLKQGNYIAPLKSDYLRESSQELNFKYGEGSGIKVTLIGRVTKIFESFETNIFEEQGNFADLSSSIHGIVELILSQMKSIKKGDAIVSPVAIYFE
ncbi:hypothetical protein JNUCC32_13350 [Paenibacillus sp. JNUCC32]|uniref:DUF6414 family protein n=1 Tax=Paenibacillus sp. JNUCC32 TaxID=2777984 RepID=UPI001787F3E9|nr:hypothetical protein [Paenibacillus sp. JNUCC-32]QOT12943.1 hypothetical protein JNUCC32_13350 [Paenibacillus sp. JNUCC-32]